MVPLSFLLREYEKRYGRSLPVINSSSVSPVLSDITGDSRESAPCSVFCCIRGEKKDGHEFAPSAVERGAAVLLAEREVSLNVPQIISQEVRRDMGRLASIIYGEPSSKMLMFAVTGTNGKSTTTWMIRHILQSAGIRTGLFGTIVYNDGAEERDAGRTTPESCEIQKSLSRMVENGCGACVLEASSHGLSFGRLEGCSFDGAVFTNLSEEHLDYHKTLEAYFAAKMILFRDYMKQNWFAAANMDDIYGKKVGELFPRNVSYFGSGEKNGDCIRATRIRNSLAGAEFSVSFPGSGEEIPVSLPLPGRFNVYNALGAITLIKSFIPDLHAVTGALLTMPQVPGRLEKYYLSNGVCVIIDFAHTPTALKNVLAELRTLCTGSLFAVFGHGGERFEANRFSLGAVASEFADRIIVTMDNPRSEDPGKIAMQILEGVNSRENPPETSLVIQRKDAVRTALDEAGAGDVVAITGKGPEKYLHIGSDFIPYSDKQTVLEWTAEKGLTWK